MYQFGATCILQQASFKLILMNFQIFVVLRLLTLFFYFLGFQFLNAQTNYFSRADSIRVINLGDTLDSPWVGGINAAQFSKIDLNFDNLEDLFIFDRTGNKILTYINLGDKYVYEPEYENHFPQLNYWALLRDFNNDGKKDIFSYVSGGIGVWKNKSSSNNLIFEKITTPYLTSYQFGNMTNLFVSKVDIPDINDIDNDGDLDVLTFGVLGNRVEYHQNFSQENGFNSDSLIFEIKNACWGHFLETGFNTNACILFDTCTNNVSNPHLPNTGSEKVSISNSKHAGSTVLSIDLNNDNIKDLILGDVSFGNIVALYNDNKGINANTSFVSQDTTFPSNTVSVDVHVFPGVFYEDIDFDGTKDLIVSPNSDNETENKESVWYYKNFGTNSLPSFNLITKNQFQNEMIEVGKSSHPIFLDYNNDGLLDFFVANFGEFDLTNSNNYVSSIQLYENTGSINSPQFELVTNDFQNISSLNIEKGLYPCFADLDNDGDVDMLLGDFSGNLHFFENFSSSISSFDLILMNPQLQDNDGNTIDVGDAAVPELFDLDNDGDLDLIIGEAEGTLNYYENIGNSTAPVFRLITEEFGNVDVKEWWNFYGFSIPKVIRNQQNELELFIGAESGFILKYGNLENNLGGSFNFIDTLIETNIGPNASPSFGYLNNDSLIDLIVGNERGGISLFLGTSENPLDLTDEQFNNTVNLFPNPCSTSINVSIPNPFAYSIFNTLGQNVLTGNSNGNINVSSLKRGVYILQIDYNFNTFNMRFIKH